MSSKEREKYLLELIKRVKEVKPTRGHEKCIECNGAGIIVEEDADTAIKSMICPYCYTTSTDGGLAFAVQMEYFTQWECLMPNGIGNIEILKNPEMTLTQEQFYCN